MKKYRLVYNELDIQPDAPVECMCPSCGDTDRRADYGMKCIFCGHNTYKPCMEVNEAFFTDENGFSNDDREHIDSLSIQDETTLGRSNIDAIIRIHDEVTL